VHLTATEYRVLRTLATYPGRRIPTDQLVRLALGPSYEDDVAVLRIYIARVRKKLEPNPVQPRLIVTETGLGYYLNANP
jgi:two-component system KDP operon response regulator KdpE